MKKAAAAGAVAGGAACMMVAASYALFAVLREPLTPAGAAAVVALVIGLVAFGIAFLAFGSGGARRRHDEPAHPPGLMARVTDLARERPALAAVVGVAAGWIFLRNPALATIVAAAMSQKDPGHHR